MRSGRSAWSSRRLRHHRHLHPCVERRTWPACAPWRTISRAVARPSWTTTYPGPRPQQGSHAAYALTFIRETGPRQWEAQRRIMDPEGHGDWMLDCEIDLRGRKLDDGPILILRRIGI